MSDSRRRTFLKRGRQLRSGETGAQSSSGSGLSGFTVDEQRISVEDELGPFPDGKPSRGSAKSWIPPKKQSGLRVVRPKRGRDLYIMGDLPFDWFQKASQCSPSALRVALAIWRKVGLRYGDAVVEITLADVKPFGVNHRKTKIAGLKQLEEAGLIELSQEGHEAYVVTVIPNVRVT